MKLFFTILWVVFLLYTNANAKEISIQEKSVILVIGTRPDTIKMAPIYHALKKMNIPVVVCSTGQHADLQLDALKLFDLTPDYNLNIMKKDQDLFHITTSILDKLKELYIRVKPSVVLVHGDTSSALAGAIAAFYLKVPIGHIEGGLRTYNMNAPFPEEFNRRAISLIASYHFAPTQQAVDCLRKENIHENTIFNVGNVIVDSLSYIKEKIVQGKLTPSPEIANVIESAHKNNFKILVLTAHRREAIPDGLRSIFIAIKKSLSLHPNLFVIYPIHPNPIIKKIIKEVGLDNFSNIFISNPLSYVDMVYLLNKADCVATDSGGLQEEAMSLSKPLLMLRNETERYEGIEAGIAQLVGFDENKILQGINAIMMPIRSFKGANTLYGSGDTAWQIAHIIKKELFS